MEFGAHRRRALVIAVAFTAYTVAFMTTYSALGSVAGALSVLPVIVAAWWYGTRVGLAAGVGAIALNAVLHALAGEPWWTVLSARGATGSVVVVIVGVLVGHVQAMRVAVARELEARSVAETAATASAARSRGILDAATEAVIVLDKDGRIVDWNRSAERIFGRSPVDLSHQRIEDLIRTGDTAAIRQEEPVSSVLAIGLASDAGEFPVEVSVGPITGDDSAASVITVRDVSQRVRDEQALRQAQKMEAIGQLAGGIAHDFNNLLTAIGGYADLLLMEQVSDEERVESAVEVRRAADRATSLTRQLLEYSRRQPVSREAADLNSIVSGVEPLLRRLLGEHILVASDLESSAIHVCVDRAQIEQVILNLAINARDAMGDGGILTIATGRVRRSLVGQVEVNVVACLRVSDTGSGMDAAVQARIFDPFFTTKDAGKGTGLGLSSAHGIVRSFDGEIRVASEVGRGSMFEVLLPIHSSPEPARAGAPEPISLGGNERILLVEDEPAVRALAARCLRGLGYDVIEAPSASTALELAADAPPDLLVTDVVMPGGSGPELAETLHQRRPELPVLYVSGYPHIGQSSPDGMIDGTLLSKPFSAEQLARAVRAALDAAAPGGRAAA